MDVVIRAVDSQFLEEVAFPAFAVGVDNAAAALERLHSAVGDVGVRKRLEEMLDRQAGGGWSDSEADLFQEAAYVLLFSDWRQTDQGWVSVESREAFAGELDHTLHLALMISRPGYPYWHIAESMRARAEVMRPPWKDRGLPGLVAGVWDAHLDFRPGDVVRTRGTNVYRPMERLAVADWSYRDRAVVAEWTEHLPRNLRTLIEREVERLRPVDVPEAREVLDYWLGIVPRPPPLVVAFSGLGPAATQWVTEIGGFAAQIRKAAATQRGLTAIITGDRP